MPLWALAARSLTTKVPLPSLKCRSPLTPYAAQRIAASPHPAHQGEGTKSNLTGTMTLPRGSTVQTCDVSVGSKFPSHESRDNGINRSSTRVSQERRTRTVKQGMADREMWILVLSPIAPLKLKCGFSAVFLSRIPLQHSQHTHATSTTRSIFYDISLHSVHFL